MQICLVFDMHMELITCTKNTVSAASFAFDHHFHIQPSTPYPSTACPDICFQPIQFPTLSSTRSYTFCSLSWCLCSTIQVRYPASTSTCTHAFSLLSWCPNSTIHIQYSASISAFGSWYSQVQPSSFPSVTWTLVVELAQSLHSWYYSSQIVNSWRRRLYLGRRNQRSKLNPQLSGEAGITEYGEQKTEAKVGCPTQISSVNSNN